MSIQDLAERLGITEFPESLLPYYPIPEERRSELCTKELICRLQERFDLFGTYYPKVLEAWEGLQKSPLLHDWADAVALCIKDGDVKNSRKMVYPKSDKTLTGDMMPLFALLPSVEGAYQEYIDRGFPEAHAKETMEGFKINLQVVEEHITGRVGLTTTYANWLGLYVKARIFYHRGLNYEIHTSPSYNPHVLRNKQTGELLPVFGKDLPIHKSGLFLGSAGATEEEGSFIASFEETEDAYIGHPSRNYLVEKEKEIFPKELWEEVYGPGDHDISVHIPRKTDFSPETVTQSMKEALEWMKICYPEWTPKAFFCSSWLLSPILNEVLGEESKIASFSSRYLRFPRKSPGMSPFGYVFPRNFESFETLPEDTRLQRALKKKYVEGSFVYDTSGIILL